VVLWEMLTGRKLFRQSSELDILKAITEQDPVPPSSRMPGVDPALDAITLRALQRSRELRYQSAREMRMELSFFLKKAREPSDTVAIGEHMQALFYDRMVEKRRLVQHAQKSGSSLEDTLFGDLDLGRSDTEPSVAPDTPPFPGARTLQTRPAVPTGTGELAGARWKWLALAACGLLAAVVVVFVLMWPDNDRNTGPAEPAAAAPADAGVAGGVPAGAESAPRDAGVVAAADAGKSVVVQPVAPVRKKKQRKRWRNKPREAATPAHEQPAPRPQEPGFLRLATQPWTTVYLQGRKLGVTPLVDLELPAGRHTLRAVNPGKGIERTIQVVIHPGQTTVKSIKF